MKRSIWEKRIPTIPALVLIFASIWVTLYLVKTGVFTVTRASPDDEPNHVTFGNITDTTFTIGFTTKSKVIAAVQVTHPDGKKEVIYNVREQQAGSTPFFTHLFEVKELTPNTRYPVALIVNGTEYSGSGTQYAVTTGPPLEDPFHSSKSITGSVILPDGTPADDTLVVITLADSQTLLTYSQPNGTYLKSLEGIRTNSLDVYYVVDTETPVTINTYREGLSSTMETVLTENGTIPPITLDSIYSAFDSIDTPDIPGGEFQLPEPEEVSDTITITAPQANAEYIDTQPTFRGTSLPNREVKLLIRTHDPVEAEVLSDKFGRWSYRPTAPLPVGQHTLTMQSEDNFGIIRSVRRSFSIFPIGSQVSESATPSATPTRTVILSPTEIPSPTATSTPVPTITIAPTPTPTVAPTNTPTPTPLMTITPTPPGSTATIVVTFFSVLLIIAGTTLLFIVG